MDYWNDIVHDPTGDVYGALAEPTTIAVSFNILRFIINIYPVECRHLGLQHCGISKQKQVPSAASLGVVQH